MFHIRDEFTCSLKAQIVTFNKEKALAGEGASTTPNIVKTNAKIRCHLYAREMNVSFIRAED